MKKGLLITLVTLLVLVIGVGAFCILNPVLAQQAVNKISGVFAEPTEPPTQPLTEPLTTQTPTEPMPNISVTANEDTIEVGETAQVTVEFLTQLENEPQIQYVSSDDNIAMVDSSGVITAKSEGECVITVFPQGYEDQKQEATFKITDKRIKQINILNNYLSKIPAEKEYKYGLKKATATLSKCIIDDFNNDGNYEMFILYALRGSEQAAEIVTVENDSAISYTSGKSYADISKAGYDSYQENIALDSYGSPYIIAESEQESSKYNQVTTTLYVMGAQRTNEVETLFAENPKDIEKTKGKYKKDSKEIKREEYVTEYTRLNNNYQVFEEYYDKTFNISEGKFVKLEMPVKLEDEYFNRIKWESSDNKIAKVNDSGLVTGLKLGQCVITGNHPSFSNSVVSVLVKVADLEDEFSEYIEKNKDETITGKAGGQMKLYGYRVKDMNNDDQRELLLYYVGNNSCQIDVVNISGSVINRSTAISRATEQGVICAFEIFKDSTSGEFVLYEGFTSETDGKKKVEFSYYRYSDGIFSKSSSDYKIIDEKTYYLGGSEVSKDNFSTSLSKYTQDNEWTKVN